MNRIANLNAGASARAATIIVPAVLLVLGTSGVVARPTLGLEAARRARAEAEERVRERELEKNRSAEYARRGGDERVAEVRRAVEALVPPRISSLDLQSLVVLVARKNQLELSSIEIGEPRETDFPVLTDRIVATDVGVRGSSALGDFVRFVEDVRALGAAASVDQARVSRVSPLDPRFEFQITLSFHHRAPPVHAATQDRAGGP